MCSVTVIWNVSTTSDIVHRQRAVVLCYLHKDSAVAMAKGLGAFHNQIHINSHDSTFSL